MTWVPEACTLPTAEQRLRLAEFDALFSMAVSPAERAGPTELRIQLPAGDGVAATTRELIARETACCSFFGFDVRASVAGTVLDVRVPSTHAAVLAAMHERVEAARERGARP